jgi:hypothetical protein
MGARRPPAGVGCTIFGVSMFFIAVVVGFVVVGRIGRTTGNCAIY